MSVMPGLLLREWGSVTTRFIPSRAFVPSMKLPRYESTAGLALQLGEGLTRRFRATPHTCGDTLASGFCWLVILVLSQWDDSGPPCARNNQNCSLSDT